jgi:hypothetical protein
MGALGFRWRRRMLILLLPRRFYRRAAPPDRGRPCQSAPYRHRAQVWLQIRALTRFDRPRDLTGINIYFGWVGCYESVGSAFLLFVFLDDRSIAGPSKRTRRQSDQFGSSARSATTVNAHPTEEPTGAQTHPTQFCREERKRAQEGEAGHLRQRINELKNTASMSQASAVKKLSGQTALRVGSTSDQFA